MTSAEAGQDMQNSSPEESLQFDHFDITRKLEHEGKPFMLQEQELVSLVAICSAAQFRGSSVVCQVLLRVLKTLEKSPRRDQYLQELFLIILSTKESVDHFFSTCNVMKFEIGEMRLNDFALDWLVIHIYRLRLSTDSDAFYKAWDYTRLHEILKHGCADLACAGYYQYEHEFSQETHPRDHVIDLLYLSLQALYDHQIYRRALPGSEKEGVSILTCITTIFRAIPRISLCLLFKRSSFYQDDEQALDMLTDVIWWLECSGSLPELFESICNNVLSLKHLSRCAVREALYKNWALPEGIKDLGVPATLYMYLNLLE